MARIRSLLLSVSTGYVLMFFSEHMFWSRVRPGDSLGQWVATWLAYSLLGFVLLSAVRHFRVASPAALFVAGGLVGWLAEGVLVQTLYDRFPLQISWTGLAWHALISVCLGWYGLRQALARPSNHAIAALGLGLGAFWGLWALFWRIEEPARASSVPGFAAFAFIVSALLILNLWLYERAGPSSFQPSRWTVAAALLALGAIFSLGTLPVAPLSLVILPVLLGMVYLALSRNRSREARPDVLATGHRQPAAGRYVWLAVMPAAAAATYATAVSLGLHWQTNWVVYLVTMPAGFVLFGVAWIRLVFPRQTARHSQPLPERRVSGEGEGHTQDGHSSRRPGPRTPTRSDGSD